MPISLDAHFSSAAPLISGGGGAGNTVRETKRETSAETAGFSAGGAVAADWVCDGDGGGEVDWHCAGGD